MTGVRPYCTFQVAGLRLGVDVHEVQEVIRHPTPNPTRVPTASPAVRGLINLRGQVVTLLDLRARLGLPPDGSPLGRAMGVVVRSPGGAVGLVVDEVGDVTDVDEAAMERPPEALPEAVRRGLRGLSPSAGPPLLILDLAKVIE